MVIFFGYIIFSICVGLLAQNWKGRDFWGWFVLALLFTPFFSGVLLVFSSNLKSLQRVADLSRIFSKEESREKLKGLQSLLEKGIYTPEEHAAKKAEALKVIVHKNHSDIEATLIALTSLVDEGLITKAELISVKEQIEAARSIDQLAVA